MLKPLHSTALELQQQLQAGRQESIDTVGDEEKAQAAEIIETTAHIQPMESELAELHEEIESADAELRELLRTNGVSGGSNGMDWEETDLQRLDQRRTGQPTGVEYSNDLGLPR